MTPLPHTLLIFTTLTLLLCACQGGPNEESPSPLPDTWGRATLNTATVAGLWDFSEVDSSEIVHYEISPDGQLTLWDYAGDTVIDGGNCYWRYGPITIAHHGENNYSVTDKDVTVPLQLTITDNTLNVRDLQSGVTIEAIPPLSGISSADLPICTSPYPF